MSAPRFVVRCECYEVGPFKDKATALRRLEQIETDKHCMYDHKIVEVD